MASVAIAVPGGNPCTSSDNKRARVMEAIEFTAYIPSDIEETPVLSTAAGREITSDGTCEV